ncbi:hypothetical protein CDAR_266281 [Caerostris darwini]|uniref:Uncharacterized protein n=1 Tax=Caerostris darwini TaxID=1538125 RepID=A0AAV4MNK9_9ARAC|nr:hypothetical protein CDAR_266281 [Caerostris darwini]
MSLTISQRHYRFETRPFDNHPKPRSPLKSPNSIIIAVHRNCNRNPSFARPSDGHRSKSPLASALSTIALSDFDSVGNCAHRTIQTLMSDYLKFKYMKA